MGQVVGLAGWLAGWLAINDERPKMPPQVLRGTRSERVARGEANDEVDRSGRRHADEGAQRAAGAAPEGGRSDFAPEGGDRPHFERRGLYLELQGHGRRRSQGYP